MSLLNILQQRYIALAGQAELWTDFRRIEDYVEDMEIEAPLNSFLPARLFPERWLYPVSEKTLNRFNHQDRSFNLPQNDIQLLIEPLTW